MERGLEGRCSRFAFELAERMRDELGCVGVIVDAKHRAVPFYGRFGFVSVSVVEGAAGSVPTPTAMYLPLGSIPPKASQKNDSRGQAR